jgi:hypothetical protein
MKKKVVSIIAFIAAILCVSFGPMNKTGIAGYAGSPLENNCTECHGGIANSGPGSIAISSPTLTDWKYTPGQTYAISVTVAQTGAKVFGFALESLTAAGENAGNMEVIDDTQTHIDSSNISGQMRKSMTHSFNGGRTNDLHTFVFNWTAPVKDIGPVTFYAAGNAANGNNFPTGDSIYTKKQMVVPAAVGISELTTLDIQLFPNPTQGQLTICGDVNEKMIVSIYDLHGRLLIHNEHIFQKSLIDVSNLSAGTYLTKIETLSGVAFRKFVKN